MNQFELTPGPVRLCPDHSTVGPDPHTFSSFALCVVRGVMDRKPIQMCSSLCMPFGWLGPPLIFAFCLSL